MEAKAAVDSADSLSFCFPCVCCVMYEVSIPGASPATGCVFGACDARDGLGQRGLGFIGGWTCCMEDWKPLTSMAIGACEVGCHFMPGTDGATEPSRTAPVRRLCARWGCILLTHTDVKTRSARERHEQEAGSGRCGQPYECRSGRTECVRAMSGRSGGQGSLGTVSGCCCPGPAGPLRLISIVPPALTR